MVQPVLPVIPFVPTDRHLAGVVLSVLTYWLFAQSIINVYPAISQSVAISEATLTLAISLCALLCGCFIVGCGELADRLGHLTLIRLGLALSLLGSLLLVVAREPVLFITARILQGLSAASIMPTTLALLKHWYQGAARQRAISYWVICSWGGTGINAMMAGSVTTLWGWRWIFILSVLVTLLSLMLLWRAHEEKAAYDHSTFDFPGLILLVTGLVLINLLISQAGHWGHYTIGSLVIGLAVIIGLFILVERRQGNRALIDFTLFTNRVWNGVAFSNFLLNGTVGTLLVTSIYLQEQRGLSALQAGVMTLGYLVTVLAMIRVGERLLQRLGARTPMVAGALLAALAFALLSCTFIPGRGYLAAVAGGYILLGLGLGCYATPSTDTAVSEAPPGKTGIASGIYKMGSSLGGAFGIAGSAALYALWQPCGASQAAQWTLWVNVIISLLCAVTSGLLVRSRSGVGPN